LLLLSATARRAGEPGTNGRLKNILRSSSVGCVQWNYEDKRLLRRSKCSCQKLQYIKKEDCRRIGGEIISNFLLAKHYKSVMMTLAGVDHHGFIKVDEVDSRSLVERAAAASCTRLKVVRRTDQVRNSGSLFS